MGEQDKIIIYFANITNLYLRKGFMMYIMR